LKKFISVKNLLAAIFLIAVLVSGYKAQDGHPEMGSAAGAIAAAIIAAAALIGFVMMHINEMNRK